MTDMELVALAFTVKTSTATELQKFLVDFEENKNTLNSIKKATSSEKSFRVIDKSTLGL